LNRREASPEDVAAIEAMLGRPLAGRCRVVVRRGSVPAVIENEPHLRDGTPMPTLYWLVDPALHEAVSRLEGSGGVHRFEEMVDPGALEAAHESYARRRTSRIVRRDAVAPSGGVGGTRRGVKCLHAHLANYLAGYADPVGEIVSGLVDVEGCERIGEALAALDCGSNSTRLFIADEDGPLRREARITRLSEGVDATGTLTDAALARTYAVLEEYRRIMDDEGVRRGLLVATSAVRDASNGEAFLDGARERVGVDAAILTGTQEASYSFAGASADLAASAQSTLVLDVGGGSTELVLDVGGALASFSMQLGCVRVTERALGADALTPARERAAIQMISSELDRAFAAVPEFARSIGAVRLVALAGTVATLVQLQSGLSEYDHDRVHHQIVSRESVRAWRERLGAETPRERLAHPGMVRGREDVLVAGLYVIEAVMDRFKVDELLSSESDILDGIVASLRGGHEGPGPDTMGG
jgi:exopolyphosphatase / guanosine-5'-triphosphate,3'-diphosphate pyrophosphatase